MVLAAAIAYGKGNGSSTTNLRRNGMASAKPMKQSDAEYVKSAESDGEYASAMKAQESKPFHLFSRNSKKQTRVTRRASPVSPSSPTCAQRTAARQGSRFRI